VLLLGKRERNCFICENKTRDSFSAATFALISLGVAIKNPVSNISNNFLDMGEKKLVLVYCSPKILISFHN
jgi:hypothetical protein